MGRVWVLEAMGVMSRLCWSWIVALVLLAVPVLATPSLPPAAPLQPPSQEEAQAIFRTAYDGRLTYDPDFPGFESEVSVRYQQQVYQGRVLVYPDGRVLVLNINREDVKQLVANELQEVATHRARVPFEVLHGDRTFEWVGTDANGAIAIRERQQGQEVASYKVRDGRIVQVNRPIGAANVTVDALATIRPPEGYITTEYQAAFRDAATGELQEVREVRDYYMKVSKYYLLHRRTIREGRNEAELRQKALPDISIIFTGVHALPEIPA
jgi:hypothetical protein